MILESLRIMTLFITANLLSLFIFQFIMDRALMKEQFFSYTFATRWRTACETPAIALNPKTQVKHVVQVHSTYIYIYKNLQICLTYIQRNLKKI